MDRRTGFFLTFREVVHHVDVTTALVPLFRYMRWAASRNEGRVYSVCVDPQSVNRIKLFPPDRLPVTGDDAVAGAVGGPWDRISMDIRHHYLYQSIRARLYEGLDWTETQIYEHPSYRDDPELARRRCEKIEAIIRSIERNGYRSQDELPADETADPERIGSIPVPDEIIVGMDRDGQFIHLKNGRHRLAVAQLLGVERLPAILSLYHPRAVDRIPQSATPLGATDRRRSPPVAPSGSD